MSRRNLNVGKIYSKNTKVQSFFQQESLTESATLNRTLFYIAKTVISTINITILIFLVLIYADLYRKTRSEFTVGLIIFSATLLLYAFTSNPIIIRAFGFRLFGLGPFALLPDLFTFAALLVLLYLSIKY